VRSLQTKLQTNCAAWPRAGLVPVFSILDKGAGVEPSQLGQPALLQTGKGPRRLQLIARREFHVLK